MAESRTSARAGGTARSKGRADETVLRKGRIEPAEARSRPKAKAGSKPAAKSASLAQLVVRRVEPELVRLLKVQAASHGRSAEEEHREILRKALKPPKKSFKELLLEMPDVGEDSDFERIRELPRDIEL